MRIVISSNEPALSEAEGSRNLTHKETLPNEISRLRSDALLR